MPYSLGIKDLCYMPLFLCSNYSSKSYLEQCSKQFLSHEKAGIVIQMYCLLSDYAKWNNWKYWDVSMHVQPLHLNRITACSLPWCLCKNTWPILLQICFPSTLMRCMVACPLCYFFFVPVSYPFLAVFSHLNVPFMAQDRCVHSEMVWLFFWHVLWLWKT